MEKILSTLEGRVATCTAGLEKLTKIEETHATKRAALSADLKREVLDAKRAEIQREALDAADEIRLALHDEGEAARKEAAGFDARKLRRRATFDPKDPARDAQIRGTWHTRLARMRVDGLEHLAEDARDRGDLALAGAIEEELEARPELERGSPAERESAKSIRKAIDAVEIPEVKRARDALAAIERAEREALERSRVLRGGRASGLSSIAEGLRQHRQAQG